MVVLVQWTVNYPLTLYCEAQSTRSVQQSSAHHDDDHYTLSSLPSPGTGSRRPVKQTQHNGLLVSLHSTALHPHYMYSL